MHKLKTAHLSGTPQPTPARLHGHTWPQWIHDVCQRRLFVNLTVTDTGDWVLRSDASGLTLYIAREERADRPRCRVVHEAEVDHCVQVQTLILETNTPSDIDALLQAISEYQYDIQSTLRAHGPADSIDTLTCVDALGDVDSPSGHFIVRERLEKICSAPLPSSAVRGFLDAVSSLVDDWLIAHGPQLPLKFPPRSN